MNNELRMDLADCGSPEALLVTILKHHPFWEPPVPVHALAFDVGILEFKDLEVDGFVGALMTDMEKSKGIILTKSGQIESRRRFTESHELGHFLIPSHKGDRKCTAKDMMENRRGTINQRQESEANRFAAGLLMPKDWFSKDVDALGSADLLHVSELSRRYGTSIQATANRYVELCEDCCAVLVTKAGTIQYVRQQRGFPKLNVSSGDRLSAQCASLQNKLGPGTVTGWTEASGETWLESTWGNSLPPVLEQTMRQGSDYQITLLLATKSDTEEDELEERLEESLEIKFRRK